MATNPQDLDALVCGLIDYDADRATMFAGKTLTDRASDAITTLRRDLLAAEATRDNALALVRSVYGAGYEQAKCGLPPSGDSHEAATSALDAVKRAERAQTLRDAAARAYEVAHNTSDISKIRDAILAMIPEG